MKNVFLPVFLCLILTACQEKQVSTSTDTSPFEKALNNFPSLEESPNHKVLTLGVFHFDRSMDGSDVIAKNHLDILSERNQADLDSLVTILKTFKPTRIAVEWRPNMQPYIDSLYLAYQKGTYQLGKNETFQLGFRLANDFGLEGVYCIDNNPPMPDNINAIDDWDAYAEEMGHEKLWHAYDEKNKQYNTYMDTIQNSLYVYDYIRLINSKKNAKRLKQLWTTGIINVGHGDKYLGPDLLGRWYRRNVRLFANAKNLAVDDSENILIIYGGAHKWVLDELFEASPEFHLMQLGDLTKR